MRTSDLMTTPRPRLLCPSVNKTLSGCIFLSVTVLFSVAGAAECATPVKPAGFAQRENWRELERFVASRTLNPEIQVVQTVTGYGEGAVNNDFYAITVDALGDTPESLATFLRKNLDRLVFAGTTYQFFAYDETNRQRWESSSPKGAVMTFLLATLNPLQPIAPIPAIEARASVVMSCAGSSSWIFSTVQTLNDGWHPVSGNRSFGVTLNADGSLQIWTKGADRAVNSGPIGLVHINNPFAREQTFLQGHAVWLRLLNNLTERLKERNPRDRQEFSVRRKYLGP